MSAARDWLAEFRRRKAASAPCANSANSARTDTQPPASPAIGAIGTIGTPPAGRRAERESWDATDWRAFYDERAAIAEINGEMPRFAAELAAYRSCVTEWMNRHILPSDGSGCASCQGAEERGAAIVPFCTEGEGRVWLHPACWAAWFEHQRQEAQIALAQLGLPSPDHE